MIRAKFTNASVTAAYGLKQWDYGQVLIIDCGCFHIQEGTEIGYYQRGISSTRYIHGCTARIPDRMLQFPDDIMAYVYIRAPDSGETVLTIKMPVAERPKPENYVLPDTAEYGRLLPPNGEPGQVLTKQNAADYAADWEYRADSIAYDGEYVQLMSGTVPVGGKVRIMKEDREIELTNDGKNIMWRYTDSNEWIVLVSLESLTGPQGPPGITPAFEIRGGHLIAKYKEE